MITLLEQIQITEKTNPSKSFVVEDVHITPECAKFVLEKRNGKNRNLIQRNIVGLTGDILANGWIYGSVIYFYRDKQNRTILFDGQHRLESIKRAGKAVQGIVGFDFGEAYRLIVDTVAVRSFAQNLAIAGYSYSGVLDGIVRILLVNQRKIYPYHVLHQQAPSKLSFSNSVKQKFFDVEKERLIESVNYIASMFRKGPMSTKDRIYSLLYYHGCFILNKPKETRLFFELLASGLGLSNVHPVYHVREFIMKAKTHPSYQKLGFLRTLPLILGFNLFMTGRTYKSVDRFTRAVDNYVAASGNGVYIVEPDDAMVSFPFDSWKKV